MRNLKKISLAIAFFASLTSGVSAQTTKSKEKKIPFKVANRYFVKNTVKDGVSFHPKITSQEEFEKLFGMAAIMGKDGLPTPIDFSKQYVIAVIDAVTNASVKLDAKSLVQKENEITLTYSRTEAKSQNSSFFRHCLIVIVDNKYKGEIKIEDDQKQEKLPFITGNRYFVNNTVEDGLFLHPKITSREEFEKLFGMAAVMGENGIPTPIDFDKQYVIAVIDPITNKETSLTVQDFARKDGTITLTYGKTESSNASSANFRHCLIVIVDNKYKEEVKINRLETPDNN